jgi:hypothetical protein
VLTAKELTADDRTRLKGSVIQILPKGGYTQEELLLAVRNLVASFVRPGGKGTEDPPYAKDPASGR